MARLSGRISVLAGMGSSVPECTEVEDSCQTSLNFSASLTPEDIPIGSQASALKRAARHETTSTRSYGRFHVPKTQMGHGDFDSWHEFSRVSSFHFS